MQRTIWGIADWLEQKIGERGILAAFMVPAIVIVIVAQFYPLFYSLYISFVDWTLTRSMEPGGFVGFANYAKMASDGVLQQTIGRTIWFALTSTGVSVILELRAGLFHRRRNTLAAHRAHHFDPADGHRAGGRRHYLADDAERPRRADQRGAARHRPAGAGLAGRPYAGDGLDRHHRHLGMDAVRLRDLRRRLVLAAGRSAEGSRGRWGHLVPDPAHGGAADAGAGGPAGGDVPAARRAADARYRFHHHLWRPGLCHPHR